MYKFFSILTMLCAVTAVAIPVEQKVNEGTKEATKEATKQGKYTQT